ncbi:MAG: glycosyltransferase family 4 protein [archaeon]
MKKKVDVVYVVASKLGSIGMGSAAYNAVKGIGHDGKLSFKVFCRGYDKRLGLNPKNVKSYGHLEYLSYPFRFLEKKMGIETINYFKHINNLFGKLIFKNLPDCKIYHSWMGLAPEAVLKAKKGGAILVLEAANSHPLNTLKILNEEFKRYDREDLIVNPKTIQKEIDLINKFDYVMCPSDFVYDSFLGQGFSKKQLVKMPYGVDLKKFSTIKNREDNKFRIVFVGSLQLRKGVQYLLQAWGELKLKNAELLIVGRVWPDADEIVKRYKNNKTIKFIGFTKNLKYYYEMSDVFVFPSLEEGSSLATYEAMASGLPSIVTFNSGSIARDEKDGFIIPIRDVKSLKKKISYFYDNPSEVKRMGKNARKFVEKYTWGNYGKNLIRAYKRMLKN